MNLGLGLLLPQKYGVAELGDNTLALFNAMAENTEKTVDCVDEIITASLAGKINHVEDFNIDAYAFKVRQNKHMSYISKKVKKETFINKDKVEEGDRYSGVSEDALPCLEDSYSILDDNNELEYAVNYIMKMQQDFLLEEGVNLKLVLKRALGGIPEAIDKLRQICLNEQLGEQIRVILSSGVSVDTLFA